MSCTVELIRVAQKQLDRITGRYYKDIVETITTLRENPRPLGTRKLAESGLWRIRIGRYRVVYTIDDKEHLVVIVRVTKRSEDTYRRL